MLPVYLILFAGFLATSFLLSGMEAGVLALSRYRIQKWEKQGNRRARVLLEYLEHPENFLWTILVGNTISNIVLFGSFVAAIYAWLFGRLWLLVPALILAAVVFYAFCELLPKMLFRMFPNRLCIALATPFRIVHLLLRPLVAPVAAASQWLGGRRFTGQLLADRGELRLAMQEADQTLTREERRMISRVLDLSHMRVRHYAIPIQQAVCVSSDLSVADYLQLCREKGFSRMPVWHAGESPRSLAGLVNVKSVLYQETIRPERTVGEFVRPALYLNQGLSLEEALRQMQRRRQRLAIVCGPDQQETGIISLQDILGAIFGEVSL